MQPHQFASESRSRLAAALFAVGRLKLDSDADSGIELLQQASRLDPACVQASAAQIVEYLRRHGRNADARQHIKVPGGEIYSA